MNLKSTFLLNQIIQFGSLLLFLMLLGRAACEGVFILEVRNSASGSSLASGQR